MPVNSLGSSRANELRNTSFQPWGSWSSVWLSHLPEHYNCFPPPKTCKVLITAARSLTSCDILQLLYVQTIVGVSIPKFQKKKLRQREAMSSNIKVVSRVCFLWHPCSMAICSAWSLSFLLHRHAHTHAHTHALLSRKSFAYCLPGRIFVLSFCSFSTTALSVHHSVQLRYSGVGTLFNLWLCTLLVQYTACITSMSDVWYLYYPECWRFVGGDGRILLTFILCFNVPSILTASTMAKVGRGWWTGHSGRERIGNINGTTIMNTIVKCQDLLDRPVRQYPITTTRYPTPYVIAVLHL